MVPESTQPVDTVISGAPPEPLTRGRALAEVVLCSGYPTQLVIAAVLYGFFHLGPGPDGNPTPPYIVALSRSIRPSSWG